MMTIRVRAGAVLLASVLLACGTNAVGTGPTPATTTANSVTPEQRTAAMLSVHAAAYHHAKILKPTTQELQLPTLSAAVTTLAADGDVLAPSRRRRAVAKLAAYAKGDPELTTAWHTLLAGQPAVAAKVQTTVDEDGGTEPSKTESKLFHVLGDPTSCPREATFFGPFIEGSGVVTVRIEMTVAGTIANVARKLDPQNWDECGGAYFKHTFLTTDTPSPTSVCPIPASFPDPSENDAHATGSEYHAKLFEDFDCPACGKTQTKNLLIVDTIKNKGPCGTENACAPNTGDPVPYEICFRLATPTSLGACVGNTPVHLTGDSGSLTACNGATAGDVVVSSRKELKFKENLANTVTYAMLWLSRTEAIQMLADIVCCPSVP